MNSRRAAIFTSLTALSAFVSIACAPESSDTSSDADDLQGSLSREKACAVRDAYLRARLEDVEHVDFEQLPAAVRARFGPDTGVVASASFDVRGVGRVYIVEEASRLVFTDGSGNLLAGAVVRFMSWWAPTGNPLQCSARDAGLSDASPAVWPGLDASPAVWTDANAPASAGAEGQLCGGTYASFPGGGCNVGLVCALGTAAFLLHDAGIVDYPPSVGRCRRPGDASAPVVRDGGFAGIPGAR